MRHIKDSTEKVKQDHPGFPTGKTLYWDKDNNEKSLGGNIVCWCKGNTPSGEMFSAGIGTFFPWVNKFSSKDSIFPWGNEFSAGIWPTFFSWGKNYLLGYEIFCLGGTKSLLG